MKLIKDKKKHLRRFESIEIINAFKMMGNKYRMNILLALRSQEAMNLDQINQVVGGDIKNIHAHTKKLADAGLIYKKYQGVTVQHFLTEYGKYATKCYELFSTEPY